MNVLLIVVFALLLAAAIYSLASRREDLRVPLWCVVIFLAVWLLYATGVLR